MYTAIAAIQLQFIPIDFGCPIITCTAADPYVLVLSERGQVMLLTLKPDPIGKSVRLACSRPQLSKVSKNALPFVSLYDYFELECDTLSCLGWAAMLCF